MYVFVLYVVWEIVMFVNRKECRCGEIEVLVSSLVFGSKWNRSKGCFCFKGTGNGVFILSVI